jgi:HAD superfamily hydrolase (TIGR01548 family)
MVASKEIISLVRKIKPSYNISSLSERAAISALKNSALMRSNVRRAIFERAKLDRRLRGLGFSTFPSLTNFILCRCPSIIGAPELQKRLAGKGIIVRDFSSRPGLAGCLRITVGSKAENNRLISELKKILPPRFDAVIFDMDEVLVDTSQSYLRAVEITAGKLSGRSISRADVKRIKQSRWFNDDIDCAYRLAGLAGRGRLGNAKGAQAVSPEERRSAAYASAAGIFQSVYLGKNFTGLIRRERPMISGKTLEALSAAGLKLGIATGRPRKEAQFAIRRAGWKKIFSAVVCWEDAKRKKPYPDPLLEAKKRLGAKNPVYIGDNAADAESARRAGMKFVMVGKAGAGSIAGADDIRKLVVAWKE